jgi:hypothetical protein
VSFSRHNTRLLWSGVVVCGCLFFLAIPLAAESLKPVSTFELNLPNQSGDTVQRGPNGLQYLTSNAIAIWYTEKHTGHLSIRDKLRAGDPWQMKMQVVSTLDGAVKQQFVFPTRKSSSDLAVLKDGHAVLLTGPLLQCFSVDPRRTTAVMLRHPDEPRELRFLRASPAGTLVWATEMSNIEALTPVNPVSCKLGPTLTENRTAPTLSGSDSFLIDANTTQIGIWRPETGWKLLFQHSCCIELARVLGPDRVAFVYIDPSMQRHFVLINLQGKVLLDDPLDMGYEVANIVAAPDARSAALILQVRQLTDTPTGVSVRHTDFKIRLYDLVTNKRILKLDEGVAGQHLFGLAISPDSSEFAILDGPKLSIYGLRR